MESLLPSEIARLVLGYLEDQKCDDAAKLFLETSPHLEECRMVLAKGRRFTRVVGDMTLNDILEKYSSMHALIQEKLNKVPDCEQLKQSGDFLEQLRFLIDGSRSQRFVVNINVPTQNAVPTSGGSPIISSSIRKRQRSGADRDRDRSKRFAKSHVESPEKQNPENVQLYCDTVEATPAESLPGHIVSKKSNGEGKSLSLKQIFSLSQTERNEYETGTSSGQSDGLLNSNLNVQKSNNEENVRYNNFHVTPNKCTMSTSTEELIKSYPSTGVQTAPWDVTDLERTVNYEPLHNLSLLSKELLNRKELHERIADNINKSILPMESTPLKEDEFGANTSFMALNNPDIFKSIVRVTDNDPAFQQFIHDYIEPIPETDTSPDEDLDSRNKPECIEREHQQKLECINIDMDLTIPEGADNRIEQMGGSKEVPLKERLRSSKQHNFRPENEGNKQVDQGKEVKSLEDQNAAAIQSIINANFAHIAPLQNESSTIKPLEIENNTCSIVSLKEVTKEPETIPATSESPNKPLDLNTFILKSNDSVEIIETRTEVEKSNIEAKKATEPETTVTNIKDNKTSKRKEKKPVKKGPIQVPQLVTEDEMMVMPTLIRCSKDDIGSFLAVPPKYPTTKNVLIPSASNSQFIPIAPKQSQAPVQEPIYCKTVNVTHRVKPGTSKFSKMIPKVSPNANPTTSSKTDTITTLQKTVPAALPNLMPTSLPNLLSVGSSKPNPVTVSKPQFVASAITTVHLPIPPNLPISNPVVFTEPKVLTQAKYQPVKSFSNIEMESSDNYSMPSNIQIELLNAPNVKESSVKETIFQESSANECIIEAPGSPSSSNNKKESITLYANENSKAALLEAAGLPSFNIEDSMSFSLSGLSPFLKLKGSKDSVSKDAPNAPNAPDEPSCIENANASQNVADVSTSPVLKRSDLITRRTPKSLIKSRSKNHRLSLSTPRRRNSHVRALDFGTPAKSSSSANKSLSNKSPNAHNRSKSLCRTSLFKSPPFSNSSPVSQKVKSPGKEGAYKVPIATRSPAPKLKGDWERYTGVDMILGGASPNSNSNPPFLDKPKSEISPPAPKTLKSWDTDLRLALAASSEEPKKKERVRKTERRVRKTKTPNKGKKRKLLETKKNKKRNSKTPQKDDVMSDQEVTSTANVSDPIEITKDLSTNNAPSSPTSDKPQLPPSDSKLPGSSEPVSKPAEIPPTLKPSTSKISPTLISKTMNQIVEKNYAEKVKKYVRLTSVPRTQGKVNCEFLNISPKKTAKFVLMPNLKDLETPQKLANSSGIPPTPRFLSPTNSSVTPFTKITRAEDSSKLPDVYPTPDCLPPTPKIVFTPNLASENTKDAIKKGEHNSGSPYYQPSSELAECPEKQLKEDLKKIAEIQTVIINTRDTKVTEFQVIKGNLPKEEAAKEELRISSSSIEISESVTIREEVTVSSVLQDTEVSTESADKSWQESNESNSSDSNSNSSSSLSSSSSSSSSDSSNTSATDTPFSSTKKNPNRSDRTCTDTSLESVQMSQEDKITVEGEEHFQSSETQNQETQDSEINVPEIKVPEIKVPDVKAPEIKEVSPHKMFSVTNTENNEETETPAKNELLVEADISETPSSSKTGSELPTNLNTRISAIMDSNENKLKKIEQKTSAKPTIISIERIAPIDCNALKVANILSNTDDNKPGSSLQGRAANNANDELRLELELKRERLKTALAAPSRGKARGRGSYASVRRGRYSVGRKAVQIVNLKNRTISSSSSKDGSDEILEEGNEKLDEKDKEGDKNLEINEECKNPEKSNAKKGKALKNSKSAKERAKKEIISEDKEPSSKIENKLDSKNKIKVKGESSQVESNLKEIVLNVEDQKCAMKAKVDQVKRDLFSDEEVFDQRTTRSKSRQISDAQRSDTSDQNVEQVKNSSLNSKEILECLQLVPANKGEVLEESYGLQNASDSHQRVFHFVYDEKTAIKKKKRKYSQSELVIHLRGEDEDDDEGTLLTNTPFEEIFNISPKPKKRVRKTAVGSIKESAELNSYEQPLATSSPILKATLLQTGSKNVPMKKNSETAEGEQAKNEKGKALFEKEMQKGKPCKRKMSTTQEQEQKKPKLKKTVPIVLDNLNVDEFLAKVHGPSESH